MKRNDPATVILLASCADRSGLVREIARFVHEQEGNIVHLDQHVDHRDKRFFIRVEWEISKGTAGGAVDALAEAFKEIGGARGMDWSLHGSAARPRLAIFVSKEPHCLYDLLSRHASGELAVEVPLVVSNHDDLRPVAERFGIPFHRFAISAEDKAGQERAEQQLLEENRIDTVVLARYMQILSAEFCARYVGRAINIHHSFLPAFAGARPYHQAYERGVKVIGATSHYVTSDLDEGPIIAQDVTPVSHRQSVSELIRIGRDLEKNVLARAVRAHCEHRVIIHDGRTVVFE
jgi:formyltetrahydrofolate deformylase